MSDRLAPDAPLYRSGVFPAPTASLNFGASGVAYALYRMACAGRSPRLLAHANLWAARALRAVGDDDAFYDETAELSREVLGRVTPYHTASGVHCVDTLLGFTTGDIARQTAGIAGFLRASSARCRNLDLTLGRSGVLLACSLLLENVGAAPASGATAVLEAGHKTMHDAWRRCGVFGDHRRSAFPYLGIAHGWAGLLYATLRWCQVTHVAIPSPAEASLHHLAALGERRGRGMRWQVSLENRDAGFMSGWCHGSAGYVHLWTEAHRSLGRGEFLELAERAAWYAWEEQPPIGQICCGLAGQAYGLLSLYQHTGAVVWLRRARDLARQAAAVPSPPQFVNSLYKGDIGVAVLLAELARPDEACMPFFGREAR